VLKVVNNAETDVNVDAELIGVCRTLGGTVTVLTGARFDSNTIEEPMKISPAEETFTSTANTFTFNAPANSLTIFEIGLVNDSCENSSGHSHYAQTSVAFFACLFVYTVSYLFSNF